MPYLALLWIHVMQRNLYGWYIITKCHTDVTDIGLMAIMSCVICVWNVMAHAQKPEFFVFRRNGRVHLNGQGRQFSRLLAAEACASAIVMLDTPCSEVVWRVLATHSIRQFPLHFPSRASPCAITFQLGSTVCNSYPAIYGWGVTSCTQGLCWKVIGRMEEAILVELW